MVGASGHLRMGGCGDWWLPSFAGGPAWEPRASPLSLAHLFILVGILLEVEPVLGSLWFSCETNYASLPAEPICDRVLRQEDEG